jgi:ankyrin repeat protein
MQYVPTDWRRLSGAAALLAVSAALVIIHARQTPGADGEDKVSTRGKRTPAKPMATELARAIRDGDLRGVRARLEAGAGVNARDAEGNTPLILAALYAGPDCVRLLLEKEADVNAVNKAGATALIRAATDPEKARLLIAAGADVKARTNVGNTVVILAARKRGNSATVKLLLARGADPNDQNELGYNAISMAAAAGDVATVRLLLDGGADVNDGGTRRTPLMWAAVGNDLPLIRLLLSRKADVNRATEYAGAPLIEAAQHDSVEAAALLLAAGARVDGVDPRTGLTALHWAAATDSPRADLVKLLLKHGADPNAAGGEKVDAFLGQPQTPLAFAQKRGATVIVAALKARGAKALPSAKSAARPARGLPDKLSQALVAGATRRAVALLQTSADKSLRAFARHAEKFDCASCHQQYLPMAAVAHARERAVPLDEEAAQDQVNWIHRQSRLSVDGSREIDRVAEVTSSAEPAYSAGYQLLALASEKVPAGPLTDARVHHLATIQAADGRWRMTLPRPPMSSGDAGATALAIRGIKHYGWRGHRAEFNRAVERGRKWLRTVRPETTEDAVYQLLGLHWAGEPAGNLAGLAKALADRQRKDGGWAQLPTLESDAYATGQVLYALALAARHPTSGGAWQRGLRFLLATQCDDGSWHVVRRAIPLQPTMSSGFPHQRDGWISAAGTSWAVLALTQAIDPPAPAKQKIEFARQIKPLLTRSCIACHGPDKHRGSFRLDSRDHLLKGGNSGVPAVVPGQAARSPLIDYVAGREEGMEMPPPSSRKRFPGLTSGEVDLLRLWIDQGAAWQK